MEPQAVIDEVFSNDESGISVDDFFAALRAKWGKEVDEYIAREENHPELYG